RRRSYTVVISSWPCPPRSHVESSFSHEAHAAGSSREQSGWAYRVPLARIPRQHRTRTRRLPAQTRSNGCVCVDAYAAFDQAADAGPLVTMQIGAASRRKGDTIATH